MNTMRYGNKSVISQIRRDDEMPYTEDGRRVDLLLNLLAIINRTTSFAIYEIAINSICYKVRQHMKSLRGYKKKEILLFDIVHDFNEEQYEKMKATYDKLDEKAQHQVIDDAIEYGIYINQSPVKESKAIFYRIRDILAKYDWLKPDEVYLNLNGQKVKTLSRHWIGDMYILKLKQSDLRGFSARSSGAIDIKGLPTRSYKHRNHMEKHSDSAIRFGEFETLNFGIGVPTSDIALFHSIYRTSAKGREDIIKMMFNFKGGENTIEGKIDNAYTSRVAEVFNVIFKSLSLEIDFEDDDDYLRGYDSQNVKLHELNGKTFLCTDYEFFLRERYENIKNEILQENLVLTDKALELEIARRMKERKFISGSFYDETGELVFE